MATQLGEALEIYNLKTQLITLYTVLPENLNSLQKEAKDSRPASKGFADIQVTDDYIYTVFDGMSWKERDKFYERGMSAPKGGHFLYVFDLAGNPVRKYTLDKNILGIHINEKQTPELRLARKAIIRS